MSKQSLSRNDIIEQLNKAYDRLFTYSQEDEFSQERFETKTEIWDLQEKLACTPK